MKVQIMCSRCGQRSREINYDQYSRIEPPEELVNDGWNSYGDAFYCEQCAKTWEERNGKGRPLWGKAHTKERVYQTMINELLDELDRAKHNESEDL